MGTIIINSAVNELDILSFILKASDKPLNMDHNQKQFLNYF